jgi:hypothetical protein
MQKYLLLTIFSISAIYFLTGCCCNKTIETAYILTTKENIKIDGSFNEKSWAKAPEHKMNLLNSWEKQPSKTAKILKNEVFEGGTIKFLLGPKYLYIGVNFIDHDILCEANNEQGHHYLNGDVLEIFIKPQNAPHYWELFFNPSKGRTSFAYNGAGMRAPSNFSIDKLMKDYHGNTKIFGTLNKSNDKYKSWNAEVAIPLKDLAAKGIPFDAKNPWTILIARYNYGNHLRSIQFSTFPKLPQINYHLLEYYAPVKVIE